MTTGPAASERETYIIRDVEAGTTIYEITGDDKLEAVEQVQGPRDSPVYPLLTVSLGTELNLQSPPELLQGFVSADINCTFLGVITIDVDLQLGVVAGSGVEC
jgi:hypothetical protein